MILVRVCLPLCFITKLFCIKPILCISTGVKLCVLFFILHRWAAVITLRYAIQYMTCNMLSGASLLWYTQEFKPCMPASAHTKKKLRSWEVYDQIYQYKSRNSINPSPKRRTEKNRQSGGQPGSSILFVCSQRDSQACRRKTQSNQDTDREQTRTGRYRVWWVSSLAALIV